MRAASLSRLVSRALALRSRVWRSESSARWCSGTLATEGGLLGVRAERPSAAMTGSAATVAVVGANDGCSGSSRAHRDLRLDLSPACCCCCWSSPSSAVAHRFLRRVLVVPPPSCCCWRLFELSVFSTNLFPLSKNIKYSFRTSFQPSHFIKSCQNNGNVDPYFDWIDESGTEWAGSLYQDFILM